MKWFETRELKCPLCKERIYVKIVNGDDIEVREEAGRLLADKMDRHFKEEHSSCK